MTLVFLFTMGIGQMWADNTPASVGTYETHSSSSKPGKDGRCVRLGDGVFMHRVSNSSWDSNGNGMKLSGNTNGIVLYLSSSMTFQASIYKKETKSAQTGTFKIYTISETNYSWFKTNAGTNETKTLTDGDKTLTSSSCTYSFEAVNPKTTGSTTTNEVELSAGYYYIVPSEDETSNNVTFLYSVTLAAGSGGGGQEASTAPTIKTQPSTTDAQYLKDATGATALSVEAEGNGTLSYQWYKNTSKSNAGGTALENCTTATYTPSTAAEGKLYYYCAVTNTESGKSATTVKSNVSGMVRVVPAPTHLVENVMATSGNWDSYIVSTNAHISNLKTITASDDKTLIKSGKESASSSRTPGITSNSSSSLVEGDHIYVQFTIEDGYELTVSDASVQVFSISNPGKYVARISDNASTPNVIATTETTVAKSDDADLFEGYDFSDSPKLSGTVTLKLFAYGWSDGYRMKSPLYIDGTVTAKKVVKTTDYALTDVKVNGTSISAANLATLKMASAYKVDLADQFAAAPTIKFNKETTITYTDDSQKVTDEEISVDATIVDGKWQAQAEIGGITYTVTAVKVTSFTVNYFDEDGTTSLGSEVVSVTGHPNASEITVPTKSFKTFADWKLSGTVVDLNNVSAGAGETVTLVASYTPAYAQSINIEQWVLDNSKNNTAFRAVLDARHYEYANLNDVDSLRADKNDGDRNEPYLGQKWKLATSEISFLLKSGSIVRVKFGNVGSNVNIKLGDNDPIPNTAAQLESPYEYTATEDVIVRLQGTGTGTVVVKQIMIDEAIAAVKLHAVVTYDAGAGTFGKANEKYTGTPLVIADATPAEDYTFAGWFLGEDQINAAAYEPTKNVTLVAHYAPKEYAIAYDGNGATSGSMSVGAAGWGTMVTPDANAFEKTGHVFSGWEITKTSDGSATGLTFSEGKFEMPKYDVTLVAQWEDNSKVAMIVETNVKYETLAAAIAAAEAGQTVQLIQDITQEEAILIDKNLTLDLNNKTFTVTNPSSEYSNRAIKVTAGTIVIENGTVDALSNETHNSGCWGSLRQEGGHLTCNNVTFKNYRSGGLGLKPVGGTLILNECTVLSEFGGGLELGNATVEVNNCTFTQTGTDAQKIYGACFGMGKMGTLTINGGTYTSNNYSFYIYTSGGTINVNSGTFAGDIKTEMNNTQYPSAVGTINISGGTFDGVGENPIVFTAVTANDHISISGGVFDAPIAKEYCAVNYVPKDNGDGTYGVKPKDGVCLIKGKVGNNTFVIDEEASLLSGTPSKNNVESKSSTYQTLTGWKFNSRPAHLGLTLSEGTFRKGDVVEVFVTSVVDNSGANDKMRVFTANDVTKMLVEGDANMVQGANRLTLPETTTNALYLVRGSENADYDMWNPYVAYFAVYRPMMPELTAITINGVAATKGTGNAFSVTLPEAGTNLASLTIVPTIIRNAAHATTPEAVISNEGAWKAGDNTYRVMDKDGDYTDYTITITLQGQAPAPDITTQPAGVAYCAGSEPTLEVVATGNELHYAWFKEAGETDEAVGTDLASYTVEAAGTYYVIVTNKVTGKLDASTTSNNAVVTLNTAAAITTQPTGQSEVVSGTEITLSVVATNATGYQWYICDDAEKHNAAVISGAEAANYVFNCSANAYYYCVVGNACGADIESNVVSVKLEPEGCNTIASIPAAEPYQYEQTGEWTLYGIDSNGRLSSSSKFVNNAKDFNDNTVNAIADQRVGIIFEKDVESLTLYATSSSTGRTWKSDQQIRVTSDEITSGSPVYTNVTATREVSTMPGNTKQYIFTANDMIIPAGKKAWLPFSGNINIFKICYTTALAEPKLPATLANQELCADAAYETFDASITNAAACEGTVSYEWYETSDTENPVATTATYTPGADATYYVVVKHAAAGHATRVAQSANLTVAHFAAPALESYSENVFQHMGTEATLSVTATGSGLAYAWYTCDAEGNNAVAVDPAVNAASMHIASVAEGVQYYKVVISNTCDVTTLSHIFKVEGWNQLEQVDVTGSTVWDMNNVSASEINLASMTPSKQNVRLLLANIEGVNNNASFNSQALMFEGQRIGRTENNVKYVSGQYVQFNVTVPGMVSVTFASNGSAQRTIQINGKQCSRTTNDGTYIKYDVAVEPGSVEIEDVQGYVRISKIEFKAEDNYHRTVNPSYLGTLCWKNNAVLGGATLYEFQGKDANNYLVFDEVEENRLEAGKPYIFMPENGSTEIKVYNTDNKPAKTESDLQPVNHMYGTITGKTLVPGVDDNMYYFSASHIWAVKDFTVNINVPAYFCYVDYVAVLNGEPAPAPAPGRRRVTMGVQGQQVATGVENVQGDKVQCTKMLINGQLFILRGEKMYDAKGQLVK